MVSAETQILFVMLNVIRSAFYGIMWRFKVSILLIYTPFRLLGRPAIVA
jgi:hypothetical protein